MLTIRLSLGNHATPFERKCRQIDLSETPPEGVFLTSDQPADLTVWYGEPTDGREGRSVSTRVVRTSHRGWFRRGPQRMLPLIATEVAPSGLDGRVFVVPEAVDRAFEPIERPEGATVAFVERNEIRQGLESIRARALRFREDLRWKSITLPLSPADLIDVALLLDPAATEDDLGGGVAEALVAGVPVVASRTRINQARALRGGRISLYPPGDANEAVHAILKQLFAPETSPPLPPDPLFSRTRPFDPASRMALLAEAWRKLT